MKPCVYKVRRKQLTSLYIGDKWVVHYRKPNSSIFHVEFFYTWKAAILRANEIAYNDAYEPRNYISVRYADIAYQTNWVRITRCPWPKVLPGKEV